MAEPPSHGFDDFVRSRTPALLRAAYLLTLPLDTGGEAVRQLFFTPDGNLVARVGDTTRSRLLIFAPDGRRISEAEEPAEVREATLLRLVTS